MTRPPAWIWTPYEEIGCSPYCDARFDEQGRKECAAASDRKRSVWIGWAGVMGVRDANRFLEVVWVNIPGRGLRRKIPGNG